MHRELGARDLEVTLGPLVGNPDLASNVWHREVAEFGEQQHLALLERQLAHRLEGLAELRVEFVAMPDSSRRPTLCVIPGMGARPGFGIVQLADLAPVVPGHDVGVADGAAGRSQVAR